MQEFRIRSLFHATVEPLYNEVLGTTKITLLYMYQVSHYIRVKKQRNIKSWDQQNYLVIRGFCYIIRPHYNEVSLYLHTINMDHAFEPENYVHTLKTG